MTEFSDETNNPSGEQSGENLILSLLTQEQVEK